MIRIRFEYECEIRINVGVKIFFSCLPSHATRRDATRRDANVFDCRILNAFEIYKILPGYHRTTPGNFVTGNDA